MVAIITQARVNSTRLPNKILLEANGRSFLGYHIDRLKQTGLPIIVATTNDGSEEPIVAFCENEKVQYWKGEEANVLKRYYDCAVAHGVTTIVRVTSDCPLIDPRLIVFGIEAYERENSNTYYSNVLQRTYPRGMDYEVFSFALLKDAYENAREPADKEHVTPYIWKNKSGHVILKHDLDSIDNSQYRLTLDTEADRQLLSILIQDYQAQQLSSNEIVAILEESPELARINEHIEQKKI